MPLLPSHTLVQSYCLLLFTSAYFLLSSPATLLNSTPLWILGESMHVRAAFFLPSTLTPYQQTTATAPGATLSQSRSSQGLNAALDPAVREVLAVLGLVLGVASVTQAILATSLRYSSTELSALGRGSSPAGTIVGNGSTKQDRERQSQISAFAEKIYNLYSTQTLFLTLAVVRVVIGGVLTGWIYIYHADRGAERFTAVRATHHVPNTIMSLLANRVVFTVMMADMLFWGYLYTVIREETREIAGLVAKRREIEDERDGWR